MIRLREIKIEGNPGHVAEVLKHFGNIEFEARRIASPLAVEFEITHALPNYYKDASGQSILYVLEPNVTVHSIWPGAKTYDDVRYASAADVTEQCITQPATRAVAMFKGKIGCYLCLGPLTKEARKSIKVGFLGI